MALLNVNYFSDVLQKQTCMTVILPDGSPASTIELPVLYLLHGRRGDNTSWLRYSSIERYVEDKYIAVIMPDAQNSYYIDMKNGFDYFKLITDELPVKVSSFFNVSSAKEHTFICGLSMGGYGAFKAALTYSDRYSIAGSLSGALDLDNRVKAGFESPFIKKLFQNCVGTDLKIKDSVNDLFHLIDVSVVNEIALPLLYQCCGTEDFLYDDNLKFRNYCVEQHIHSEYNESHGGHDWEYWDNAIQNFLNYLPLENIIRKEEL